MGTCGRPPTWPKSTAFAQGTTTISSTSTMHFIAVSQLPPGTKATYLHVVCAFWPKKEIPHCIQWTIKGDCIDYTGNISTKTADLSTVKILFNSIISMPNARCMMGNLKDFYLGTPMEPKDYAYMRIPIAMLPTDIMDHYQLHALVHNGHIYIKIQHGMYGLPQAGLLANLQLQQFLKPHGYAPAPSLPASGVITHNQLHLPWSSMTLLSNTPTGRMLSISCQPSSNTTRSVKIRWPPGTVASPSPGTTTTTPLIS